MKIQLSQIHPSPNPIRKTWDEEKMKELQWSLMEEGQVEPIGVRENGSGYIVVWGHRRVEAARRATWKEIEAMVVPANEIDNLIQAGIENLAKEDMSIKDKAEWAYLLTSKFGLSQREIGRRTSIHQTLIGKWIAYKKEIDQGVSQGLPLNKQDEGFHKVLEVSHSLGNDTQAKNKVLSKVSTDRLDVIQTRAVADAYRDASSPQVKEAVLKVDVERNDTAEDIIKKADVIASADKPIPSLNQAPLVIQFYRCWQDLGVSINYLKHVKQDIPTARLILKQGIGYCEQRLAEMKEILEPTDDRQDR